MADRYMYLPIVGLLVMLGWGIPELTTGLAVRRWLPAMAALGVLAYAGVARAQVAHWRDSIALWERALAVTHENARAHANLAHALSKQGRLADAVPHYEEALRLKPDFAEAHNNLGYALAAQGRNADAIAHYREAVRLLPDYHEALNNLGVALLAQGSVEDGLQALREALRLQPGLAQLRENLAHAYGAHARAQAEAGKLEAAIADQREVLRLSAGDADDHYDLAVLLYRNGQAAEAIREFEAALRLDPQHAQAQKALEALARSAAK
jgi:tetratricopeptide (TPR) repeat protein